MVMQSFSALLPEIFLAAYALLALMAGAFFGKDKIAGPILGLTALVFIGLAAFLGLGTLPAGPAVVDLAPNDAFTRFGKITILLSAAAILLIGQDYLQRRGLLRFELPVLVALSVLGMMLMVSAADLMMLYVALELQSLPLYVLAALRRDSAKSTEAGLKYFVLGALSSGLLLYGASLTYGFAGSTEFATILPLAVEGAAPIGLLFGLVFLLAGLAFKISAVPFHMWTPDVYEGAPTPITAFFATAPKVAAMVLLARLVQDAFGRMPLAWGQILAFLALASMAWGAIAAIGQRDLKRLMAYSSIAHMGYALIGLTVGTAQGVQASLLYLAIYVTMNIGTFAFILAMERDGKPVTEIAALNLLAKAAPGRALALLILLFSLAGVPPMLGFFGKFYVLQAAVDGGLLWLALSGAVLSVIGAFYYLRLVYLMYFGTEGEVLDLRMAPMQWLALAGAAVIMLAGVVNLFGLEPLAAQAADALLR